MRILWYSNAPWSSTGYGNPTRLLAQHLTNLGHKIAIACNYGLRGGRIDAGGIRLYPAGYERNSNDIVQAHADDFKADVIISLYDVWPLNFLKRMTPWLAWTPIDHSPIGAPVKDALPGESSGAVFSTESPMTISSTPRTAATSFSVITPT